MSGELHTDPAAPTLIAFTSGTTRDPRVSSTVTRR